MPKKYPSKLEPALYSWIYDAALADFRSGAIRIAVKDLIERARKSGQFSSINNSLSTQIADRLVTDYPILAGKIERRQRGTRGKNKVTAVPMSSDLDLVMTYLRGERPRIAVTGLVCIPTGSVTSVTIDVGRLAAALRASQSSL